MTITTTITFVANIPFQTRSFFVLIKDWPKLLTWGRSGSSNPSCIVKCNQCNATTPFCRLTCHFWDSLTRVVSRVYPSLSPGGNSARHCLGTSSQPMCSNVAVFTIAMCSNLLNLNKECEPVLAIFRMLPFLLSRFYIQTYFSTSVIFFALYE